MGSRQHSHPQGRNARATQRGTVALTVRGISKTAGYMRGWRRGDHPPPQLRHPLPVRRRPGLRRGRARRRPHGLPLPADRERRLAGPDRHRVRRRRRRPPLQAARRPVHGRLPPPGPPGGDRGRPHPRARPRPGRRPPDRLHPPRPRPRRRAAGLPRRRGPRLRPRKGRRREPEPARARALSVLPLRPRAEVRHPRIRRRQVDGLREHPGAARQRPRDPADPARRPLARPHRDRRPRRRRLAVALRRRLLPPQPDGDPSRPARPRCAPSRA